MINKAIYLYNKVDTKVPPSSIHLAEVHSAALEMLEKPQITQFLLDNVKFWTLARQFFSRGSETPWENYKSLEECLIAFLASKHPKQNEPVFEGMLVDSCSGSDQTHSQAPPLLLKPRKKMNKNQKKRLRAIKSSTTSKQIDWQDRRPMLENPILDLNNLTNRLNSFDEFKLKLSAMDENNIHMSQMIVQQLENAICQIGVGATGMEVFDILGAAHKADTQRYYCGFKLADLVYAAWCALIPSDVKEEVVDNDVNDHDDLPHDSPDSDEIKALNYLRTLLSQDGCNVFAAKLGAPYDNDQLAIRNMKEWLTIVELFNSNFSERTNELFQTDTLTIESLFSLLFGNWPNIDLPRNKAFNRFLSEQINLNSQAAITIASILFNPEVLMKEEVIQKMQNSRYPDYKTDLHKTYTNIQENHIRNHSGENKPDYNTVPIRFFSSQGYFMAAPYHIWKKLKKLSSHSKHFENKAESIGSRKRTREVKNQKVNIKSKISKESIEDGHFNRARRGDLIERLLRRGFFENNMKEYERLLFFNQEPEKMDQPYHSSVTWKGFGDFVHDTDKYVVQLYQSKWPLNRETYLSQAKTKKDYKAFNLNAKNIVLEDTIRPQRQRVVLGLEGFDDEYMLNI